MHRSLLVLAFSTRAKERREEEGTDGQRGEWVSVQDRVGGQREAEPVNARRLFYYRLTFDTNLVERSRPLPRSFHVSFLPTFGPVSTLRSIKVAKQPGRRLVRRRRSTAKSSRESAAGWSEGPSRLE